MGPGKAYHLPAIKTKATNMPMLKLDPTCPKVSTSRSRQAMSSPPTRNPRPKFRNKVKKPKTGSYVKEQAAMCQSQQATNCGHMTLALEFP